MKLKQTINTGRLLFLATGCIALVTSCASKNLLGAQQAYKMGNISKAKSSINSAAAKAKIGGKDSELIFAEQGNILATAGDNEGAKAAFKKADHSIEKNQLKANVRIAAESGAALTNLNTLPYVGSPTERIMTTAYLATTYVASGDLSAARSVVKKTKNRQKQIFAKFSKQIAKGEKSLKEYQANNSKAKTMKVDMTKLDSVENNLTRAASSYKAYSRYSVPYAEAIGGVILGSGTGKETSRAVESFRRVLGSYPSNSQIKKAISRVQSDSKSTHLFVEVGVAPKLVSGGLLQIPYKIYAPIQKGGKVSTLAMSFPKFEVQNVSTTIPSIYSGGSAIKPSLISDFDRMAGSEYKRKLPSTIARTVTGAVAKFYATNTIQKEVNNPLVDLLANAYNITTAQADLRVWATLPKRVSYACIPTPSNKTLKIGNTSVPLQSSGDNLVVVRILNGKPFIKTSSKF